jgi:hypothetical protein
MHNTNPKKSNSSLPVAEKDLSIIICIPACNEPEILQTLKSILKCRPPKDSVEVLVLLNSSEKPSYDVFESNLQAEQDILAFSSMHSNKHFSIYCVHQKDIPEKIAGVGYARKLAMDIALKRFKSINNLDGIILSLDADTKCDPGYLREVEKHFANNPHSDGCSIYFEHPLQGTAFPEKIYLGIIQYELHMRFYIQGLRYAGHPHAFHTLGSSFAVKAGTYASQGGMNKRKAGEDFYFLHKIIALGNFHELNTTCLQPSPRPSSRVPFGTGPVIQKFSEEKISYLPSYNPRVFDDLKCLLEKVPSMYNANQSIIKESLLSCPETIRDYLEPGIYERLEEINKNIAGEAAFLKRFFRWFSIFQVLKFINFSHARYYSKQPVEQSAREFLHRTDTESLKAQNALELLLYLRKVQRNTGN